MYLFYRDTSEGKPSFPWCFLILGLYYGTPVDLPADGVQVRRITAASQPPSRAAICKMCLVSDHKPVRLIAK
jgi:hypothetical protein